MLTLELQAEVMAATFWSFQTSSESYTTNRFNLKLIDLKSKVLSMIGPKRKGPKYVKLLTSSSTRQRGRRAKREDETSVAEMHNRWSFSKEGKSRSNRGVEERLSSLEPVTGGLVVQRSSCKLARECDRARAAGSTATRRSTYISAFCKVGPATVSNANKSESEISTRRRRVIR